MELYKQKAGGGKDLILLNDYCPNPAMKNESQTQFFDLKIHHMEIVEKKLEAGPDLAGHWDEVKDIFRQNKSCITKISRV